MCPDWDKGEMTKRAPHFCKVEVELLGTAFTEADHQRNKAEQEKGKMRKGTGREPLGDIAVASATPVLHVYVAF